MALVLIKKTVPKKPEPVAEDLEALKELGLVPTTEPEPKKATAMYLPTKKPSHDTHHNGARVKVSFKLFDWVKHYQLGDEGTVIDSYPATGLAAADHDPERYRLYKVKMDNPRDDRSECLLRAWEISKA